MEYFDLYSADRQPLGRRILRGSPIPRGTYHIVVQVMTVNMDGRILLTQRAQGKSGAGRWECTGGCAVSGETSRQAAARELFEETGIRAQPQSLQHIWTMRGDTMLLDFYITQQNVRLEDMRLQPTEVSAAKWVSFERMEEMVRAGHTIPTVTKWFFACRDVLRSYTSADY